MDSPTLLALAPLLAILIGGGVGLWAGRRLTGKTQLYLLSGVAALCLIVIVRLAVVSPGQEAAAFMPFAILTGLMFPALFGGIAGAIAGRAWRRRRSE